MWIVGEHVPGEENWHRKKKLKKAHKFHSEKAVHPGSRIQYKPRYLLCVIYLQPWFSNLICM
jgi:hypothetical protein